MSDSMYDSHIVWQTKLGTMRCYYSRAEWYEKFAERKNMSLKCLSQDELNELKHNQDVSRQKALAMGFTGSVCRDCNNMQMVRNGTCEKCIVCGSTSGCS